MLIGGSPCQGFSFAGKQLNFDDPRSKLFFEFVKILKELKQLNPDIKFLLENVKMKKAYEQVITEHLEVEPIIINSALVSAQNRVRLYWTNIENVSQPEDKGIMLKDVLEDGSNQIGASRGRYLVDGKRQDYKQKTAGLTTQRVELRSDNKSNTLTTVSKDNIVIIENHKSKVGLRCVGGLVKNKRWLEDGKALQRNFSQGERIYSVEGKSPCLSTNNGGSTGAGNVLITYNMDEFTYRKLTPVECERLQTVPDNYTKAVAKTQRHKMLGNGWTVDVIAHIFSNLKK